MKQVLKLLPIGPRRDPASLLLLAAGLVLPALAARLTRTALGFGYQAWAHEEPPKNPADPAVQWKHAVVWTMLSGALGGLGRLVARRLLAETPVPTEGLDLERKAKFALR
jgi:hypothetical protein